MAARRFAGRRVVITGASRGIGAALAERLVAEGADVAIVARTLERHDHLAGSLRETAAWIAPYGRRVALIAADLADEADRARIIPEAVAGLGGPIDVLVNNAAAAIYGLPSEISLKRRRLSFEVNVHAPLDLAQAVLPAMLERGEGWIVNISSATARPAAGPPYPRDGLRARTGMYGASKVALNRLTQALAQELHGTGVRVNTVEPRAAVMSEGAAALVGTIVKPEHVESMEQMVEATLVVCDCPEDFTGRTCVSLDLIDEFGLKVHALNGGPLAT